MALVSRLDILLITKLGQTEAALKKGGGLFSTFTRGLTKTNKQLLLMGAGAAGIRLVTQGLRSAVTASDDFNKSLNQSLAILADVTAAQKAQLRLAAQTASFGKRASAAEAAKGLFFLESAGFGPEAAAAALPAAIDFAQAGGGMFDLSTAIDLLTDAQTALGLTSKDTEKNLRNLVEVSDALVGANTLANATVQQFSESLTTKAATAARALGKDMNETLAVLAAFADQGIKGAEAGTALNIVWRDMQTKLIKNEKAFDAMGVAVFDSAEEMRHTADILADLEDALDGSSDKLKKQTLLAAGFTDKSIAYVTALIGMSEKIQGFNDRLDEMDGKTKQVSNAMQTEFEKLKTTWGDTFGFIARNSIGELIEEQAGQVNTAIGLLIESLQILNTGMDTAAKANDIEIKFALPGVGDFGTGTVGAALKLVEEKGAGRALLDEMKQLREEFDSTAGAAFRLRKRLRENEPERPASPFGVAGGAAKGLVPGFFASLSDSVGGIMEDVSKAIEDPMFKTFRQLEARFDATKIGMNEFDLARREVRELGMKGLPSELQETLLNSIGRFQTKTESDKRAADEGQAADRLFDEFQKRMERIPDVMAELAADQDRFAQRFETATEAFDRTIVDLQFRLMEGQDEESIRRAMVAAVEERNQRVGRDAQMPRGVAAVTQGTQAAIALESRTQNFDKQKLDAQEEANGHLEDIKNNQEAGLQLTPAPIGGPP